MTARVNCWTAEALRLTQQLEVLFGVQCTHSSACLREEDVGCEGQVARDFRDDFERQDVEQRGRLWFWLEFSHTERRQWRQEQTRCQASKSD